MGRKGANSSKREKRKQNLIKLINEQEGKKISAKQDSIVAMYKRKFKDDDSFNQSAVSRLLQDNLVFKRIICDGEAYITLVDYAKKISTIKEKYVKCEAKLEYLTNYRIKTSGNPENLLSAIEKSYRNQIIESKIIGNYIYLTFANDYSKYELDALDQSNLETVLQNVNNEVNNKKNGN